MAVTHFADPNSGAYLGQFLKGATPPPGALEVPAPPGGLHIWQNGQWVAPAPTVPAEISKVQLKRATEQLQISPGVTQWDAIKSVLAAADADTREDWDLISVVPRNHPTVITLASVLGVSEAEMDAVWIVGATL